MSVVRKLMDVMDVMDTGSEESGDVDFLDVS